LPLRWTNLPSVPSVVLPIVSLVRNDRALLLLGFIFQQLTKYIGFAAVFICLRAKLSNLTCSKNKKNGR
jgi:hypothetical protein